MKKLLALALLTGSIHLMAMDADACIGLPDNPGSSSASEAQAGSVKPINEDARLLTQEDLEVHNALMLTTLLKKVGCCAGMLAFMTATAVGDVAGTYAILRFVIRAHLTCPPCDCI